MHTYRLAVGSWRYRQLPTKYRQLPTENRRSSVGVYQTLTRSSALISRCALISRPDSTVGGKLTNHSYHFQLLPGYFPGRHAPRFGGNLCLNWLQLFHAFSSFLLRCFHPASFKTSLHIISDANTTFSHTHYCILWQYANFYADNSTVPLPGFE